MGLSEQKALDIVKGLLRRFLTWHLSALVLSISISFPAVAALSARLYTEGEIAAAIALPITPMQFLKNLKNAWDYEWLVQSPFYSDANLRKFFNANKVAWEQDSQAGQAPDFGNGRVTIEALSLPKMTVEFIRSRDKSPSTRNISVSGFLRIHIESKPRFTVGLVREIFGKESEDKLDFGIDTDAHSHNPTTAGSLFYDHDKELGIARYEKYWVSFGVKKTKPGLPDMEYKFAADEQIEEIVMFQAEP